MQGKKEFPSQTNSPIGFVKDYHSDSPQIDQLACLHAEYINHAPRCAYYYLCSSLQVTYLVRYACSSCDHNVIL